MNDARVLAIWLGRVLANALAGGLAFAIVGLFCGALSGFIFGIIFDGSLGGSLIIASYGILVGVACGVAGVLIHLVAAVVAKPGEFWEPSFNLTASVSLGQVWGTVAAIAAFVAFELIDSQIHQASFSTTVGEDVTFFCLFAPIIMICGAIAGAIWKRD